MDTKKVTILAKLVYEKSNKKIPSHICLIQARNMLSNDLTKNKPLEKLADDIIWAYNQ